jgi:hypothetical protein
VKEMQSPSANFSICHSQWTKRGNPESIVNKRTIHSHANAIIFGYISQKISSHINANKLVTSHSAQTGSSSYRDLLLQTIIMQRRN